MISQPDRDRARRVMRSPEPVDYVVVGHRDALAEAETLRQELAAAATRIANLSAQCNRNTEQIGRLQREAAVTEAERDRLQRSVEAWGQTARLYATNAADAQADRDAMREVVEAAKAVRELWRYDAMGAAEPEIHAFVAAVDALPTKDDGPVDIRPDPLLSQVVEVP